MGKASRTLTHLPIGTKATVDTLDPDSNIKRRLLDLGFTRGTVVEAVQKSPGGDPIAYLVRGAVIALRSEDSATVLLCSQ